jgi:hypothetical protein
MAQVVDALMTRRGTLQLIKIENDVSVKANLHEQVKRRGRNHTAMVESFNGHLRDECLSEFGS